MASHVLLVNGGRWTKKISSSDLPFFCPGEICAASPGVPGQYPSTRQRETNGTGLRVSATLTM